MNSKRRFRMAVLWLAAILLLQACSAAGDFDPEDQKEYGISGVYLGQNIQEAVDILKPSKADFMDMVSRESYTVEQLASGTGTMAIGMLLVDRTQVIVKVKDGAIQSIMLGGVPQEDAQTFKTNRGLAMYDSVEQLKKLYGEVSGEKEVTIKGSKYSATFGISDDKVVWFRFDTL